MSGLSEWRSLTSSGEIADLPASGFRYKYAMDFVLDLLGVEGIAFSALGAGIPTPGILTRSFGGEWKCHIEDASGNVVWEQTVELRYTFVALIMSMLGMVGFSSFVWWISGETITTTNCGGALAEGEAPQTLGAEVGFAIPAGGSDYTSNTATILTEWTSPIYLCNIPPGSTFHIDFHNIGSSGLRYSIASVQTQTIAGGGAYIRIPQMGMVFAARPGAGGMACASYHAAAGTLPELSDEAVVWDSTVGTSAGTAVWVPYGNGGRLALIWQGYGALLYAESDNMADADGWEGPATVLPGHTLLGACRDRAGVLHILAKNEAGAVVGYRASRSLNREVLLSVSEPTVCMLETGGALNVSSASLFTYQNGVYYLMVDGSNQIEYYEGANGMALWRSAAPEG
jgi:hypothetical protein